MRHDAGAMSRAIRLPEDYRLKAFVELPTDDYLDTP